MTSQVNSTTCTTPNASVDDAMLLDQTGCSADTKLFDKCSTRLSSLKGHTADAPDIRAYLASRIIQANEKSDPLRHQTFFSSMPMTVHLLCNTVRKDQALLSTPRQHLTDTVSVLDKAVQFAQLVSESSNEKKRHLHQSVSAPILVNKRARVMGLKESGDPSVPPLGVRYQRRNSFVIPKSRSMRFHSFSGCLGSIESLTNDLSLQENGNFSLSDKNGQSQSASEKD